MKFTSKAEREQTLSSKVLGSRHTRVWSSVPVSTWRQRLMGTVVRRPLSPPVSMASIRASVSLLRMQSMSCRCDRSPELSSRRSPGIRPAEPAVDFGSAFRPSNRSTSSRSTSRMVSSTQRSSPPSADSMELGSAERNKSWKPGSALVHGNFV